MKKYDITETVRLLKEAGYPPDRIESSLFVQSLGSVDWIIGRIVWDVIKWLIEENNIAIIVYPSIHGRFSYYTVYSEFGFSKPCCEGSMKVVSQADSLLYADAYNDGIASACEWIINRKKEVTDS